MGAKITTDAAPLPASSPLIAHAPLAMAQTEGESHLIRFANPAFCRLLGRTPEELTGRPFHEIFPLLGGCLSALNRVYSENASTTCTEERPQGESAAHWVCTLWPVAASESWSRGAMVLVTEMPMSMRDVREMNEALLVAGLRQHELTGEAERLNLRLHEEIDERIVHQNQVLALNAELEERVQKRTASLRQAVASLENEIAERKRLEAQVVEIAEQERKSLGMDLHDELAQKLLGTSLLALAVKRGLAKQLDILEPQAAHVVDLLNQSVEMVRNLARVSYPVELESHGLRAALQALLAQFEDSSRVHCELFYGDTFQFKEAAAIHLYRIVQEAVSNAIRHGEAKNLEVHCASRWGHPVLTIRDDGSGFDQSSRHSGMGLHLFQYRAHLLEARVRVRSQPGLGTTVTCILPVQRFPSGA